MRRKAPKTPFVLLLLITLLFGRKKAPQEETSSSETPPPFQTPQALQKSISESEVVRARDRLRLASVEREIIGGALTKIYEAEARGQLNETERTQLVQRYKADLKRVDSEVDNYKNIVDLAELESAKADLLKSFQLKLLEIDQRINKIRPALQQSPITSQTPADSVLQAAPKADGPTVQNQPEPKEKSPKEKSKNKAEERIDAVREEVLRAMERLEQIEAEG